MDPYQNTQNTYNRIPDGESAQKTESWALIEAARKIADVITAGDDNDKEVRKKRREALRLNWHLWTIFQAELTTADENFPEEIRINVLTLCQFIDKHTVACLAEPTADKMRILIDINRNIAAGLAAMPEETENSASSNAPATGPAQADSDTNTPPTQPLSFDTEA